MLAEDASFSIGVFVLLMLSVGLSLAQIATVVAGFLICSAVFQIPAGIFADRYGNKTSILIGAVIMTAGFGVFAFANSFLAFLFGYSLMGAGQAMKKGADVAFIYNELKRCGKPTSFKKIYGKLEFYLNLFWVVASISGGFLYVWSPRLPFLLEFGFSILSIPLIMSLSEVSIPKVSKSVGKHIKESMVYSFKTPGFSKVFVFSALIGSLAVVTFQYLQPFYVELGIKEQYFGAIAAATFVFRALGALYSDQVGKWFSIDKYLVLHSLVFTLFLLFFGMSQNWVLILGFVAIFYFLRGLYNPTITNFINNRVEDAKRSTLLSVNSQFLTVFSSLIMLVTGLVASQFSLQLVFFVVACLSNVFLILYVLSLRKVEA